MNTFNCQSCNAHNSASARFCTNCGKSLTLVQTSPYESPSSQPQGALVSEFAFAGFWKRFVAYVLDIIIYSSAFVLVAVLLGASVMDFKDPSVDEKMAAAGFYFLYYPGWWLYFSIMESTSLQGTLGKKILGIKVTNLHGQPIGFGQATGRHFSGLITQMTVGIGYLIAAFSARKQALHDMVASTLVVNNRYGPQQIKTACENPGPGMSAGGIIGVILLVLIIPVGGILAAIAIPAYQDYTMRTHVVSAISETGHIQSLITEHATETGYWPNSLEQLTEDDAVLNSTAYHVLLMDDGEYQIIYKRPKLLANSRIIFTPELNNEGNYSWDCYSDDMKQRYLPKYCRE